MAEKYLSRQARRAAERAARRTGQPAKQGSKRTGTIWPLIVGASAVLLLVARLVWPSQGNTVPTVPGGPGLTVPLQGAQHVSAGEAHPPYNSTPPTSGWHYDQPANWGIYTTSIPDEQQVHNLEHGGIMVQYRPDASPDLVQQLRQVVGRYRSKVVLAPYPGLDAPIVLTAWGRIDQLGAFDEGRIVAFIDAYRNQGPERVPD
ncbi:MAG: DUF3105 domain-containing protein [Deinococcus sp.]|nr:DUF3105 domain-containing protein [Deinococcus sp.]